MANYCYNKITIKGEQGAIREMLSFTFGEKENAPFHFDTISPVPEELSGNPDLGYWWRLDHWGTRSGPMELSIETFPHQTVVEFDTAWSPAVGIVEELAKKFPNLTFIIQYEESGCDFSGARKYENGELVRELEGRYQDYPATAHPVEDEDGKEVEGEWLEPYVLE